MNKVVLSFAQLTTHQLYGILKLRSEVFVVEQNCAYQDIDNHDLSAKHVLFCEGDELLAYSRLLPKGLTYAKPSIGRVVVSAKARGRKLGRELLVFSIYQCQKIWPNEDIKIGAQCYLKGFYTSLGFEAISEDYLEDGIPHLDMQLAKDKQITTSIA